MTVLTLKSSMKDLEKVSLTSPIRPILKNNRYKEKKHANVKPATKKIMFLAKSEKIFLIIVTVLSLTSLIFTFGAIFIDRNAIVGTDEHPSICMLSETHDCYSAYSSQLSCILVETNVRVDLLLSCVGFVTAVMLTSFQLFNCQLIVAFMLIGLCKLFFIVTALLIILTNNDFYYSAINEAFDGFCPDDICFSGRVNIVVAFILLLGSFLTTCFMMFIVFTIGNHIIRLYENAYEVEASARWNSMTASMIP
ncbi:unnamed protein product [Caenorhabditis sp. 36 PRJEB53466]|nr:unnamed protein product [Caenorhabditis sp. 36 PRJEB53466]